jgi:hypothetical protein
LLVGENKLSVWLLEGARRFRRDSEISSILEALAHREDARRCLVLLGAMLETPELIPRLLHVLRPTHKEEHRQGTRARRPREFANIDPKVDVGGL